MWNEIDFITEENLKRHVAETIKKYDKKLIPYDLKYFNRNIIDPVKLLFDKMVYSASWEGIIANEIFRQRDKANNNDIGYFHQTIFKYMNNCEVPNNGDKGGWDIIYTNPNGILIPGTDTNVHRIYVEMKNKHNTMNSTATGKTYIKMQNQILNDDDCACFLVEVISKHSGNFVWNPSVDGVKVSHKLIRRVSVDNFYTLVTGDDRAFYKICRVLPDVIEEVINSRTEVTVPNDTAFEDIKEMARQFGEPNDFNIAMAFYMLGFGQYPSFQ